jgi:ferredoxin-thioredoxin reductase catalytic chain
VSTDSGISKDRIETLRAELARDAESGGYHLNPDAEFASALAEGLLVNEGRLGYRSCPCRLGTGDAEADLDIVCPCYYRDADLAEWGACYCALYVSQGVLDGDVELGSIPERRPVDGAEATDADGAAESGPLRAGGSTPVWRCRVCGYLCGREQPPEKCPICKASQERFEKFWGVGEGSE